MLKVKTGKPVELVNCGKNLKTLRIVQKSGKVSKFQPINVSLLETSANGKLVFKAIPVRRSVSETLPKNKFVFPVVANRSVSEQVTKSTDTLKIPPKTRTHEGPEKKVKVATRKRKMQTNKKQVSKKQKTELKKMLDYSPSGLMLEEVKRRFVEMIENQ